MRKLMYVELVKKRHGESLKVAGHLFKSEIQQLLAGGYYVHCSARVEIPKQLSSKRTA